MVIEPHLFTNLKHPYPVKTFKIVEKFFQASLTSGRDFLSLKIALFPTEVFYKEEVEFSGEYCLRRKLTALEQLFTILRQQFFGRERL